MGNKGYDDDDEWSHGQNKYKMMKLLLLLTILTNLFTIYIFILPHHPENSIMKAQLEGSLSVIQELHQKLDSTNMLVQALLIELTTRQQEHQQPYSSSYKVNNDDDGPQKLAFGYANNCLMRMKQELKEFMSYEVGGECLVGDVFAEKLMLKGCHLLPPRRCHPKSPTNYPDPKPLPESLWALIPPHTLTTWDSFPCKTYQQCLKTIHHHLQNDDKRWLNDDDELLGGLNFGINQVLSTKPNGTIRIGLDINGERATGNFAARMMQESVTIITTTFNSDAPFSHFIASRGLVPLHIKLSQRLPFFENTLDIVHSGENGLGNWMQESVLEYALYDVFRVLRPGGLLWLDHFFCLSSHINTTYSLIVAQVGFKSLRWHNGEGRHQCYISALLEKPKL
ncbi:putative ATRAD3 [Senna tora]|uniref:Putative ATRAD3 n=1 Tax=Senna tora TaxID=362788 RepID=A0A834VX76_9FABA|nr:putative ATRAD3 [Senna tora]